MVPHRTEQAWRGWQGWLGLGLWLLAAALSLAGVRVFRLWFYQCAWWGFILALDALIARRRGASFILDRPVSFLWLAGASVPFWFLFELINLAALHNWHYLGVERVALWRWLGAFVAYATVLPGLLLVYELLNAWGVKIGRGVRPFPAGARWYPGFIAAGGITLAICLVWPGIFFPLAWVWLIFLLEPVNHRLGAPSLVRHWQAGDLSPVVRLVLAGLICGLCWEAWNFLSGARWAYTLPYLERPRLFAMPLAGFLGFIPFALECYVFAASLTLVTNGRGWPGQDGPALRPLPAGRAWLLGLAGLGFSLWVMWLMDNHLFMAYAP